jgi:flagellar biosynthesis protein FlhF
MMDVKKITAATSREALQQLRELLGPDTVILSNRAVPGGVELVAMVATEALPPLSPPARVAAPRVAAPAPRRDGVASGELDALKRELREMQGRLEARIDEANWSGIAGRDPARATVLRELLGAGFSPALARQASASLPADAVAQPLEWARALLAANLPVAAADTLVSEGGVYALVGPTGVGKTTTTAKLAARVVARHGSAALALVSTDTQRPGGQEVLRLHARMLGVMLHSVRDADELRIALGELRTKHTVLVDTAGLGHRDRQVAGQLAMLDATDGGGAGPRRVRRLLCLSAAAAGDTLGEVARAHAGSGLHGCIITKLDEAASIGAVLDVAIRRRLALHYVANGQRVPEDLHAADARQLLAYALRPRKAAPSHVLADEELPMLIGATA